MRISAKLSVSIDHRSWQRVSGLLSSNITRHTTKNINKDTVTRIVIIFCRSWEEIKVIDASRSQTDAAQYLSQVCVTWVCPREYAPNTGVYLCPCTQHQTLWLLHMAHTTFFFTYLRFCLEHLEMFPQRKKHFALSLKFKIKKKEKNWTFFPWKKIWGRGYYHSYFCWKIIKNLYRRVDLHVYRSTRHTKHKGKKDKWTAIFLRNAEHKTHLSALIEFVFSSDWSSATNPSFQRLFIHQVHSSFISLQAAVPHVFLWRKVVTMNDTKTPAGFYSAHVFVYVVCARHLMTTATEGDRSLPNCQERQPQARSFTVLSTVYHVRLPEKQKFHLENLFCFRSLFLFTELQTTKANDQFTIVSDWDKQRNVVLHKHTHTNKTKQKKKKKGLGNLDPLTKLTKIKGGQVSSWMWHVSCH